jgi:N-acetylglucosamine malate deacetylase 2
MGSATEEDTMPFTLAAATCPQCGSARQALPVGPLPRARTVLAVTARPGQESADLGLLLYAFRRHGACVALLSLTRGEASPLNSTCQRLETIRPWELLTAAGLLGVSSVAVADYPDGGLSNHAITNLTEQVRREIREQDPDVMLVIDPAGGDADNAAVARAVCRAAKQAGLPVLARMQPTAHGGRLADLGPAIAAAHAVRRSAIAAHASQSRARPRGEPAWPSQPSRERLRWLVPPAA